MAPVIHCVRHGQGFHNIDKQYHLRDPSLTDKGKAQAREVREAHYQDQSKISLVTASPLTRTLQTAYVTFGPALENKQCKPKILAIPDAQETSDDPCDTGSDAKDLQDFTEKEGLPVDLSLLPDDWNVKGLKSRYSPHSNAIKERAKATRLLLRQRARELADAGNQNPEIGLATHGGFLHYFTNDWENADKKPGTGWENCETRSYTFMHDFTKDDDDFAELVETAESRKARGAEGKQKGRQEQEKMFEETMEGWEAQGLERPDKMGETESSNTANEPTPFIAQNIKDEALGMQPSSPRVKAQA